MVTQDDTGCFPAMCHIGREYLLAGPAPQIWNCEGPLIAKTRSFLHKYVVDICLHHVVSPTNKFHIFPLFCIIRTYMFGRRKFGS